jgi:hypothetical protein
MLFYPRTLSFVLIGVSVALAGCATVDQNVTSLYRPVAVAKGGGGALALTATGSLTRERKERPALWIVGAVKNSDGERVANVTSQLSGDELLLDAFEQELTAAGYTVSRDVSRPEAATKAVNLTRVQLTLDETQGALKAEGSCSVLVALELWKKGAVTKKLEYESKFSDFAVKDRDQLMQTALRTALQNLMSRAMPEIVATLGGS